METYLLFSPKANSHILTYVYVKENGKIVSYSFDEDYIVKMDEPQIKSVKDLETKFSKGESENSPKLIKKEFIDLHESLFFLNGTLENFENGEKYYKKLPQIINPYDLDFDDDEIIEVSSPGKNVNIDDNFDDDDLLDNSHEDEDDFFPEGDKEEI